MGASSSVLKGDDYSKRADSSKELADTILKIFFSRADFKDLLSLANLTSCSTYVFTTSEALQSLFTHLQVYPKLGKKGEILYAPVSKLAPGLIASKDSLDQDKRKALEERNIICMDVAYFYVRIFQIYAALALTVLDAVPTRKRKGVLVSKNTKQGQRAIFTGGSISKKSNAYSQIIGTPFSPFIEMDALQKEFVLREGTPTYLQLQTNKGLFSIEWNAVLKDMTQPLSMNCYFGKTRPIPLTITMTPDSSTRIILSINGTSIIEFFKEAGPSAWLFKCIGSTFESDSIVTFKNCLDAYFDKLPEVQSQSQSSSQTQGIGFRSAVSALGPTQGITIAPGASTFQSFDDIKKIFDKRFKGEDFPKAYCIARAMTLLNPIFSTELLDQRQPFYSQICQARYDFESSENMPRADRTPAANVYLKSLVSLYYDDYVVRGNTVTFIQTETGRSTLQQASKKLAMLYNIKDNQETFIESTSRFRQFGLCPTGNRVIEIVNKEFVTKLQNEVIWPMLKFQEDHTKKVNDLLKKMFLVDEKGNLKFQAVIKNGGKEAVTQFSRAAASLLLNYYLKSEAFYIKGVLMFEQSVNTGAFKFV